MVLRAGDLGSSRFLANFRYVTSQLAGSAGLSGSRFVGVDEAVRAFAASGDVPWGRNGDGSEFCYGVFHGRD